MAVFAAVYAILGLIPVSRLIGSVSFLTMAETFSPLTGMILGPLDGGLSVLVGTFVSIALGKPVGFDGLDFIPGVVGAVTAGFAFRGKVKTTAALSVVLFAAYMVDPLSAPFVDVGSVPVPFLWMHMLATVLFVVLSYLVRSGVNLVSQIVMTVSVVFVSTMNAHVAGAIMYENVLVRINQMAPTTVTKAWGIIFAVYPIERVFFTVVGSIIAIGVMKALPPSALKPLRQPSGPVAP